METVNKDQNANQPSQKHDNIISGSNPLGDQVIEKGYATNAYQGTVGDIPEPMMGPPPLEMDDIPSKEGGGKKEKEQEKPRESFNPQLNDLSDNERNKAAERMADSILNGYQAINMMGNNWVQISDKQINKMVMDGEINLKTPVPFSTYNYVSLGEFIREVNAANKDLLTVDPEWRREVRVPLVQVLAKHGHGITPEYQLAYMFGSDALYKMWTLYQQKSTINQILKFAKEQTAERNTSKRPVQTSTMKQAVTDLKEETTGQPEQTYYTPPPEQQQQSTAGVPIQDQIMQKHHAAAAGGSASAMSDLGNPGKLKNIDQVYQEEAEIVKRKNRARATVHADSMPKVRKRKSGLQTPGANKKTSGMKRGPKPGYKKSKGSSAINDAGI